MEDTLPIGATIPNGDFAIRKVEDDRVLGDGINENTTWNFDFISPLESAALTLKLTPKSSLIQTDNIGIDADGLKRICSPPLPEEELDPFCLTETTEVFADLRDSVGDLSEVHLDFYSSDPILRHALSPTGIPMVQADDAIISFAQLELTFTNGTAMTAPMSID